MRKSIQSYLVTPGKWSWTEITSYLANSFRWEFELLKQPPYWPDLVPFEFYIVLQLNTFLKGHNFHSTKEANCGDLISRAKYIFFGRSRGIADSLAKMYPITNRSSMLNTFLLHPCTIFANDNNFWSKHFYFYFTFVSMLESFFAGDFLQFSIWKQFWSDIFKSYQVGCSANSSPLLPWCSFKAIIILKSERSSCYISSISISLSPWWNFHFYWKLIAKFNVVNKDILILKN